MEDGAGAGEVGDICTLMGHVSCWWWWLLVMMVMVTVSLVMMLTPIRFTSTGHMLLRALCPKGQHGP